MTRSLSTSTPSEAVYRSPATGDFGGHQKEGIGGRFQEWRAGLEAEGETGKVRAHDFAIPELGRAPVHSANLSRLGMTAEVEIDNDMPSPCTTVQKMVAIVRDRSLAVTA